MRDFTREINALNEYADTQILEISYRFHNGLIKWYYANNENNHFLILICDYNENCFVKSYVVISNRGSLEISGYLGDAIKYGSFLLDKNNSLSEFYKTASERILDLPNPRNAEVHLYKNPEDIFAIIDKYSKREIIQKHRDNPNNKNIDKPRFFNHIRRAPISDEHYQYVLNVLGRDVAEYLKKYGLTAVFVKDPRRQRYLHILENGHLL